MDLSQLLSLSENSSLKHFVMVPRLQSEIDLETSNVTSERDCEILYTKLRKKPSKFKEYTEMSCSTFDYVLQSIYEDIKKLDTNFRMSIRPEEKLFMTLRVLSTGSSVSSLARPFGIGISTLAGIVNETCKAICKKLAKKHMPKPKLHQMLNSTQEFQEKWNFPNCVGSLGAKQFNMSVKTFRSKCKNSKKGCPILLQAIADANSRFVSVELLTFDEDDFQESKLDELMTDKSIVPPLQYPPNSVERFPNVLIADERFKLEDYLLRPYTGRGLTEQMLNFNKRLLSAMTVESALHMLADRYHVLRRTMELGSERSSNMVHACCLLHNVIIDKDGIDESRYRNPSSLIKKVKKFKLLCLRGRSYTRRAKFIREKFCEYLWDNRIGSENKE